MDGLILLWSHGFTIFQTGIPKWFISNFEVVNTCKNKKRGKLCQFWSSVYKNLVLNLNRLVLSVLAWYEIKAYSATEMKSNLHLYDKSQI